MSQLKGSLSINSENLFPIIKKWLYSDHDIFLRELVSNASDAITKLKKLESVGEASFDLSTPLTIRVTLSPENKTITVEDNGIGMSFDEVQKYINDIAFSGAKDFLEKYKDKTDDEQIIGHFGLGFYSAFMVADRVEMETKSYRDNEDAVHWEANDGTEFSMEKGSRTERGTKITLHLNDSSYEFANEYRVREILDKYCSFMPYPIFLAKDGAETEEKETPVNTTDPLWNKTPSQCTEEEYKEFYRNVFHDYRDPLFHIHLNMDYPFRLKGILFVPPVDRSLRKIEGTIKLYNNQVFVAENIKEVIPEYLLLLKGVIDCPDLPLNVSRSSLQNDGFAKKISDYITKKLAEKLLAIFRTEREQYEKDWKDINPFIKYGYLSDDKFREKIHEAMLFETLKGGFLTIDELLKEDETEAEKNEPKETSDEETKDEEKEEKPEEPARKIAYITDPDSQSQYMNLYKEHDLDAIFLTEILDQHLVQRMEADHPKVRFVRIDAELPEGMEETNEDAEKVKKLLDTLVPSAPALRLSALKDETLSSVLLENEDNRRMLDMMRMMGMDASMMPNKGQSTLILNTKHPLVQYMLHKDEEDEKSPILKELYYLALLRHGSIAPEELTNYLKDHEKLLLQLLPKA